MLEGARAPSVDGGAVGAGGADVDCAIKLTPEMTNTLDVRITLATGNFCCTCASSFIFWRSRLFVMKLKAHNALVVDIFAIVVAHKLNHLVVAGHALKG